MNAEQIKKLSIGYLKQPLEEKTVMFIEYYYNGARGVISKLFRDYLSGPLYKDYKFVWVARDYEETLKNFGSLLDDGRIWICVANGFDYVRFLNTAKYIFSATYLPGFFIKRAGQVVYYAPLDFFIHKKTYTNAMLWRLCPTMNNADRIFIENDSAEVYDFAKRFGISEKMKHIDIKPECGFTEENREDKKYIFLSLMDRKRSVKSLGIFQYVYDTVTSLAEAYGYEVYWKISLDLYRKYREDEMYVLAFKNIYSNETDCRGFLEYADIVISDNYTDTQTADYYCENVIFYYNENVEYEELQTKGRVMYTADYARLLDILEMKLDNRKSITDTVNMNNVPVLLECPMELCGDCGYGVTGPVSIGNPVTSQDEKDPVRILIVIDVTGVESTVGVLKDMLEKYKSKAHITVFFCTAAGGKLYEYLDEMNTDISYICRTGAIRCNETERKEVIRRIDWEAEEKDAALNRAERVLRDEWKRIIGIKLYDYAVVMSGISNFWDNMDRFAPANETFLFKKGDSAEETVNNIKSILDRIDIY